MISLSRLVSVSTAVLLLGSAQADSGQNDPYSMQRLLPNRKFRQRGLIRSISAGRERIDGLSFVALDSQGRIVVAGHSIHRDDPLAWNPDSVPAVARFTSDGRLDASFGGDGIVVLPLTGLVTGLAVDSRNRVAISGSFSEPVVAATTTPYAVRLLEDGTLDPSFADGGFARSDAAPKLRRLRADPRDDALVGIDSETIVRLTASGTPDPSFGIGGTASIPSQSFGLAIDDQGRCVVSSDAAIVRVSPDGTQDPTFGAGGVLRGPNGGTMSARAVAIDGQGRIVMRGSEDGVSRGVYRFLPTGAPDPAFGVDGAAAIPIAVPGDAEAAGDLGLGVSRGATARYAFSSTLLYYAANLSRQNGFGSLVQAVDPDQPRNLTAYVARNPQAKHRQSRTFLPDVAVSDDGAKAYAVGWTVVQDDGGRRIKETPVLLCLDLTSPARAALPDFTAAWVAQPTADSSDGAVRFGGTMRVKNVGPGAAANGRVSFFLSDDAVSDDGDRFLFRQAIGPLRPGQSRVIDLAGPSFLGTDIATHGKFLIAVVNGDGVVPESDTGNDAAVSPAAFD